MADLTPAANAKHSNTVKTPGKPADTIQYGFKRISPANLLEPDGHRTYPSRLRGEKWMNACLKPQLEPWVPKEIAFLFEVVRRAMIYAEFFLPLASLAVEQSHRVLEAGARLRCEQLGLLPQKAGKPKTVPNIPFAELVRALRQARKIPADQSDYWTAMVHLRNRFSHPASGNSHIHRLDDAVGVLADHAAVLNRLFQ